MGNQGVKKYNLNHTKNKMKLFSVSASCVYYIWGVCECMCCLWYVCMLCVYVMFVVCVCMTCMEMYMHIYCVCVIYMCVCMVYVCMLCVRCSGMIYARCM